jgi:hypothetical protein
MAGASHELRTVFPQHATIFFSLWLEAKDGTAFPWSGYDVTFRIGSDILSAGNGLAIDVDNDRIIVTREASRYRCGRHGVELLLTDKETGIVYVPVDGTITITEDDDR